MNNELNFTISCEQIDQLKTNDIIEKNKTVVRKPTQISCLQVNSAPDNLKTQLLSLQQTTTHNVLIYHCLLKT